MKRTMIWAIKAPNTNKDEAKERPFLYLELTDGEARRWDRTPVEDRTPGTKVRVASYR